MNRGREGSVSDIEFVWAMLILACSPCIQAYETSRIIVPKKPLQIPSLERYNVYDNNIQLYRNEMALALESSVVSMTYNLGYRPSCHISQTFRLFCYILRSIREPSSNWLCKQILVHHVSLPSKSKHTFYHALASDVWCSVNSLITNLKSFNYLLDSFIYATGY